ncbi:MAG: hypothetical protein PHP55_12545 [Methanoculleus sp.]|jgi:hypothetical protein|nr:hypothetical protein [Methanoculleus sp.]
MAEIKQRIVVTTIEGDVPVETEYVADAYRIVGGEYVLMYQGEEVARIRAEDVTLGNDVTGGIRTVYSRS